MSAKSIIVVIILIVLVVAGAFWVYNPNKSSENAPILSDFRVEQPDLVTLGRGLTKVEVWVIPTGTGITEANHAKLGDAVLTSGESEMQIWKLAIPTEAMTVTEVYAKGFDSENNEYRKSLPLTGATEIYNALWMNIPSKEEALKVGESVEFEGLTLELAKILQDSRCPSDVQCIQAGEVEAEVKLTVATTTATSTPSKPESRTVSTTDSGLSFQNYFISIVKVIPESKTSTTTVDFSAYEVTFRIEKDIKL